MGYAVKELFYTLQGEGAQTGRAAVFLRFAGCNLWNGREADREQAICRFCDTDFVGTDGPGGGRFPDAECLAAAVTRTLRQGLAPQQDNSALPAESATGRPLVVCTGGEPLLQLDEALLAALHHAGFEVSVETNGTQPLPTGNQRIDWVTVSPKAGSELVLTSGDELKLVYPQPRPGAEPERYSGLTFQHFFLQPCDGTDGVRERNAAQVVAYCLTHPKWRLSLQTHKLLGIP